jgi:asparagine synthase (glutamine-hydrolysing)
MVHAIRSRGPDDSGVWCDQAAGLALGHARLSILDLSAEGHQPMASASGRYVIVYNGEVYNFHELRRELEQLGARFRGHSDTEVILAAFEQWGLEPAVRRFVGMFAFALWDRQERVLHLGRDRIGIKPLYFGWAEQSFLVGSELKAFRAFEGFRPDVDRNVVASYLRFNYVPAPYSIFRHVYKLPAGCLLKVPASRIARSGDFSPDPDDRQAGWRPVRYWSAREAAERGLAAPFMGSDAEAIEELDRWLREAVRLRMIADVPLGAFLSGGVDSSTVVALMQAQHSRPIRTFTIGFHETDYNEAGFARAVAAHLGTDHTELYVTPQEAMTVIPRLPEMYDEPFADSSQIPTHLVSALARRHVTVSLSGDGGDELFGGYNRYFWGRRIWRAIGWMPVTARRMLARGIMLMSPQAWSALFARMDPVMTLPQSPGDKLHKLAATLAVKNQDALYARLLSHWKDPAAVVPGSVELTRGTSMGLPQTRGPDPGCFTQRMMLLDLVAYLPDDLLVKLDRASMAVSLEARVPLLDHRIVEFAWRLPLSMKIRHGQGKWVLRQVLARYVPPELMERPKMGFAVPLDMWLRGPLRDWAESLLDERRLKKEGMLAPAPIREKWDEHLSGKRNWQYLLWDVLMFQAWVEEWASPPRVFSS